MAYVRTVKTASGAVAVHIVHSNRRGSREIEHIGSAHTPGEVEVLKPNNGCISVKTPWTSTTGNSLTLRELLRLGLLLFPPSLMNC